MALKDTLTLPTKTDAIAVRPESLPVPTGKTERRELRTVNGKTFVHAEKAPDGKEIRTCQTHIGAVCYRDDDGQLRSIDTTIRNLGTHVGIEWAPYRFKLHETGIGFDFQSREGGSCSVTLTGIGGEKFEDSPKPEVSDNVITYRDVRPGCDIVFKCLNERVKTLRILRDELAPRTFDWSVTSDKPELIDSTLTGTDAAGNQLELSNEVAGAVIRETWSGKASMPFSEESASVVYPVEIDPTVTVNPTSSADDGREFGGSVVFTNLLVGVAGSSITAFVRFPTVGVPNGADITSATLGLYQTGWSNEPGGGGTVYARTIDNCPQFDEGSNRPSTVSLTTASAVFPTGGPEQQKNITITSIAQEIIDRAGWVENNALGIIIVGTGSYYSYVSSYDAGSNIPSLSITYTAAEVITPSTLALTLTTFAPTVTQGTTIIPNTLGLALTTFAPTVTATRTGSGVIAGESSAIKSIISHRRR